MKKISKLLLLLVATVLLAVCFVGCSAKNYTVTFKNGETTVTTATINEGTTIYPANMAVNEGVVFEGWFSDEELTKEFNFATLIASDLTLYAKFTSNLYTVTYNLGGATGTIPIQQSVNANGSFTVTNTVPNWIGYEFKGWSDGTKLYNANEEYTVDGTDNVVLYAVWEYKTVHISFYDGDGVKMEGYDRDIPYNGDVIAPDSELVPTPNFCFVNSGWQDEKGEDISLKNIVKDTDFYAAYDYVPSDLSLFKFSLNEDGESYSIAAKNSNISGRIALPTEYNGMTVTSVDKQGFYFCNQINVLYIPATYRTIKTEAFLFASELSEVYIEEGLQRIEACAFKYMNALNYFELPKSLNDIHWFGISNLFNFDFMGYDYLTEEERLRIDNFKFTTVEDGYYSWNDTDKALYGDNEKKLLYVSPSISTLNVKGTVEEIYPCLCNNYPKLTNINIIGNIKIIGPSAFSFCYYLTDINIVGNVQKLYGSEINNFDGVNLLNRGVFASTAISNIVFREGLEYIGDGTFFMCSLLTGVTLPYTVEYISEQAFENSSNNITGLETPVGIAAGGLAQLTMQENDKYYIDQNKAVIEKGTGTNGGDTLLFYCMNANGTEYTIPAGVTSLTPFAFAYNTNLTVLTILEGVEEIPFAFCQYSIELITVNLPASLKYLTHDLPTEYNTWGGVFRLGIYGCFLNCSKLTTIKFAEGSKLEKISANSFNGIGCISLSIPASVKKIEPYSIYGDNLTSIIVDSANENYCDIDGVLITKDKTTLVSYPAGKMTTEYIIPAGVENIGVAAFNGCDNLQKVIMGANVKRIEKFAFNVCYDRFYGESVEEIVECGLEEVVMNNGLESIGDGAFNLCYNLKKITFTGPVPQLIKGSIEEGCEHNIFGYMDNNTGDYLLFPHLKFNVPAAYIMEYYMAWYNYRPSYIEGFEASELPNIAYDFDTKGGEAIDTVYGLMLMDLPMPQKENSYFWGWYINDGTLADNNWGEMISAPYIFIGGNHATLFARWESYQLQNGQKGIWAYELIEGKRIKADIPYYKQVWFRYTPSINCSVLLNGIDIVEQYEYFCVTSLSVDFKDENWFDYSAEMDNNGHFILMAGNTYYFMFFSYNETDLIVYVTLDFFDGIGENLLVSLSAVLPKKLN